VTWLEDFLTSKWPGSFTALALAPDDPPHDLSELEMTWMPWRPGAATDQETPLFIFHSTHHANRSPMSETSLSRQLTC